MMNRLSVSTSNVPSTTQLTKAWLSALRLAGANLPSLTLWLVLPLSLHQPWRYSWWESHHASVDRQDVSHRQLPSPSYRYGQEIPPTRSQCVWAHAAIGRKIGENRQFWTLNTFGQRATGSWTHGHWTILDNGHRVTGNGLMDVARNNRAETENCTNIARPWTGYIF
jgi:hypothetical protein